MVMNKDIEILQKQFASLCDKQDKLYHKEFEDVFTVIYDMDKGTNKNFPFSNEAIAKQALEKTGHINDMGFVADFFGYERIFKEGKNVQLQILNLLAESVPSEPEQSTDEWKFVSMRIIAPQPIMQIIDDIVLNEAIEGEGLFANLTEIPYEDEFEDKYLMIKAYGVECSLTAFWNDLKLYKVIGDSGFLCDEYKRLLLLTLNKEAEFIKANTDTPAKIKNHIRATIKKFDAIPVWGLFFQILTLQGLCRWLEGINIKEDEKSYAEVQSLYDWICTQLISKEIEFCYKPYGKKDKERLKPLCNYLYSTGFGKLIQSKLFETTKPQQLDNNLIPEELRTMQAIKMFDKAASANLLEKTSEGYKWKGQSNELAAFIDCSSTTLKIRPSNNRVPWKLYKQAFNLSEKELKAAKDAKKDYDMERRTKPDKWNVIFRICSI